MTTTISIEYFFDLSGYSHAILFHGNALPWEPLSRIKGYLSSFPLGKIEVGIPEGVYLVHPELISIGKGTVVEPGAYIRGPCIIGENCTIRHGAYLRGEVIAGNECVIGHDTEVKHTILLDHVHAAHFAYLGDCILGKKVNLGAGTKCANLRLDNKPISIHFEEKVYSTGLRKLGAILGDGTQLGCNTVTNPGTLTGKEVFSYPCTNFGGMIPEKCVIKPSAPCIIIPK
jgi:NDP-sugar pyrophosphorylase family protein